MTKNNVTETPVLENIYAKDANLNVVDPTFGGLQIDFNTCIASVNGLTKMTAEYNIEIGKLLFNMKKLCKKSKVMNKYLVMFKSLRFSKETGDKFIQMYRDKNLVDFIDFVPPAWNAMYACIGLTSDEWNVALNKELITFTSTIVEIADTVAYLKDLSIKGTLEDMKNKQGKVTVPKKEKDLNGGGTVKKKSTTQSNKFVTDVFGVQHYDTQVSVFNKTADDKVTSFNLKYDLSGVGNAEAKAINYKLNQLGKYVQEQIKFAKLTKYVSIVNEEVPVSALGIMMEDEKKAA